MAQEVTDSTLYRSRDAWVGGVCAGIAERYDFDPIVMRILAVLLAGVTLGLGAIVYVVLWAYLPRDPEPAAPYDIKPEHAESVARGSLDYAFSHGSDSLDASDDIGGLPIIPRLAIAGGLMLLFLGVATIISPLVSGTHWWQFWPLAFLIAGLCLIVIPVRSKNEVLWHAIGIVAAAFSATVFPMSLGVIGWETIPYAFMRLWVLVVAAVILFGTGIYRNKGALIIMGAFCIVAFCFIALIAFSLPGDVGALFVHMPDGRSLRIAILPS